MDVVIVYNTVDDLVFKIGIVSAIVEMCLILRIIGTMAKLLFEELVRGEGERDEIY